MVPVIQCSARSFLFRRCTLIGTHRGPHSFQCGRAAYIASNAAAAPEDGLNYITITDSPASNAEYGGGGASGDWSGGDSGGGSDD